MSENPTTEVAVPQDAEVVPVEARKEQTLEEQVANMWDVVFGLQEKVARLEAWAQEQG